MFKEASDSVITRREIEKLVVMSAIMCDEKSGT
jgi:hypothetical protein